MTKVYLAPKAIRNRYTSEIAIEKPWKNAVEQLDDDGATEKLNNS